ncbi:MAG: hypothetical protein ACYTXI_38590 [Nostoc sp.]|uniref:Uncharacterized protein n=1 Tax=Nostoc flagelliforme CCNUN1 TaxID=2038116 RepID=A0A2K8T1Z6_9NOSO|nr:hypothetical protein [Nostoc flagelliforme]AUB41716.1 hypothetical protein COO91_07778 [Nostoc flagelliforme CCNUN1]
MTPFNKSKLFQRYTTAKKETAIAITNISDDAYLKPTDIGEVVGMSAAAVNN